MRAGQYRGCRLADQKEQSALLHATSIFTVHFVAAEVLRRLILPGGVFLLGLGVGSAVGSLVGGPTSFLEGKTSRRVLLVAGVLSSIVLPKLGFILGVALGLANGMRLERHQFRALGMG